MLAVPADLNTRIQSTHGWQIQGELTSSGSISLLGGGGLREDLMKFGSKTFSTQKFNARALLALTDPLDEFLGCVT